MSSWTHVTLHLDDRTTFRVEPPSTEREMCRVGVHIDYQNPATIWLSPKAADGLIAAIQEAKERAWPTPPGIEADPLLAATGEEDPEASEQSGEEG